MKISILVGDVGMACFCLSPILMSIGFATYIRKFWGQGIVEAMKQDRIPLASKLIYGGAGSAVIGIALFLFSMMLFFQGPSTSTPKPNLYLIGVFTVLVIMQLFRGVWRQQSKPIRILALALLYVFMCSMLYGFIKSITPPPTKNSTGMYQPTPASNIYDLASANYDIHSIPPALTNLPVLPCPWGLST